MDVFDNVNSFNDIADRRERIIRKSAHILGGLAWTQPFSNGNKRTALSVTIYFLRKNGYDIPIKNKKKKRNYLISKKRQYSNLKKTNYHIRG